MVSSFGKPKPSLFQFLDSVGGIPDNNQNVDIRKINTELREYFSKMTVDEILEELIIEFIKRPNGRVLKFIGFCYFHKGQLDHAIAAYKKSLEVTSEDPVAIYEDLGRCYILKRDIDNARLCFNKSYRYDFEFFLSIFGWDFLLVTAVGRVRRRPPIFGESFDEFSASAMKIELMADAISIEFGNKKGHKSLVNMKFENEMQSMAAEYAINSKKANEEINIIRNTASKLLQELK